MAGHNQFGTCQKCKKQILWVRMVSGKSMPCDTGFVYYKEIAGGKDRIVLTNGQVAVGEIQNTSDGATGIGYVSHFATCKYGNMFRRKKKSDGR